jgi:hypothetical protein
MANLYYCHPINRGSGILRAVLTPEEARGLLSEHRAQYAGQQFPSAKADQTIDFAVLRLSEEDLGQMWEAGFYVFGDDITKIEQAVQACTAKLSQMPPTSQTPVSLAYTLLFSGVKRHEQDSNP